MMKLSRRFIDAVRLSSLPAYRLVRNAGNFHPSLLSKWIHGAELIRPNDERVIAVGRELGLSPADCFESIDEEQPASAARLEGASA